MNNRITIEFYFYHFNEDGNPVLNADSEHNKVRMSDDSAIEVVQQTLIGKYFDMLPGYIEIKFNEKLILGEDDYTDDLLATWESLLTGILMDYQEPPWPLLSLSLNSYNIIASEEELEIALVRPSLLESEDERFNYKHIPLEEFNNAAFDASKRFIKFINNFNFDEEESSYKYVLETQKQLEDKFSN